MIPQNLLKKAGQAFQEKEERDPNKSKTGGRNSLFASLGSAMKDGEKRKFEVLLFTPKYVLREREDELQDDLLTISFPIDMHDINLKGKYYPVVCKSQTVEYPFMENTDDIQCPICQKGYELKKKYWDKLTPILKEYGNYQHIPDDMKSDLQEEDRLWKGVLNKRVYDYIPIIAVKIGDKKDDIDIQGNIQWIKTPVDLLKKVRNEIEEGNWPFAEDFTKSGTPVKSEYTPEYLVKIVVEKNDKGFVSYDFSIRLNKDYILKTSDEGIVLKNENRGIEEMNIEYSDIYGYFENVFSDWENKSNASKFLEDYNIDQKVVESVMGTKDDDDDESYDPEDEDVDIDEEEFDKF